MRRKMFVMVILTSCLSACAAVPVKQSEEQVTISKTKTVSVHLDDPEHPVLVEAARKTFPSPASAYDFLRLYALNGDVTWLVAIYCERGRESWRVLPIKKGYPDGSGMEVELELLLMLAYNYKQVRIVSIFPSRGYSGANKELIVREIVGTPISLGSSEKISNQFIFPVLEEFGVYKKSLDGLRAHLVITSAGVFGIYVRPSGMAYREFRRKTAGAKNLRAVLDQIPAIPGQIVSGLLRGVPLNNWLAVREKLQSAGIDVFFVPHRTQEKFFVRKKK